MAPPGTKLPVTVFVPDSTAPVGVTPETVRIAPFALWPSGLVMATVFSPAVAAVVSRLRVNCVGLVKVTELTVTPPLTEAAMWLAKPGPPVSGPGSKKPEPDVEVPVTVTETAAWPAAIVGGLAAEGEAGGGARSCVARTPHPPKSSMAEYSWNVQKVMSSLGSTTVCE